ncbi:MAG: hypothetical protein ACYCU3_14460 [Streptosporangiaceae bacterium]
MTDSRYPVVLAAPGGQDHDNHTDDQRRWHHKQLDLIVRQWHDGAMSTARKRYAIAEENRRYWSGDHRGRTGTPVTQNTPPDIDTRIPKGSAA